MRPLRPLVSYQGGKAVLAPRIADVMNVPRERPFVELCAGTAAVSLELLNRGHHGPIALVDSGPWGLVWSQLGSGTFDLRAFRRYCASVPRNPKSVRGFLEDLATQPATRDTAPVFLLLQAGSFGGRAITDEGGRWRHHGFRTHWRGEVRGRECQETRPTLAPRLPELLRRVEALVNALPGRVRGWRARAEDWRGHSDETVYIDPPYRGTLEYPHELDAVALAERLPSVVWVSERRPLGPHAVSLGRNRRAGMERASRPDRSRDEWLTRFGR